MSDKPKGVEVTLHTVKTSKGSTVSVGLKDEETVVIRLRRPVTDVSPDEPTSIPVTIEELEGVPMRTVRIAISKEAAICLSELVGVLVISQPTFWKDFLGSPTADKLMDAILTTAGVENELVQTLKRQKDSLE